MTYFEGKFDKLHCDIQELEADRSKYRKELDKLRLDNEALKLERTCQDREIEKQDRATYDLEEQMKLKDERIKMLHSQYELVKAFNLEKDQMLAGDKRKRLA